MADRLSCGACSGDGFAFGEPCAPCKGRGWVLARPERDAAIELLCEHVSAADAQSILDALDAYRDTVLLPWLAEIELVRPTGWREEFEPRDITRGPREKEFKPATKRVVKCEPGDTGRLFRVAGQ